MRTGVVPADSLVFTDAQPCPADLAEPYGVLDLADINAFEETLVRNDTLVLKFFLNVSKEEQRERFIARLENPEKHWKFSADDLRERGYWDDYQLAFEDALSATSTETAPWYIIPADRKWYRNLVIASILVQTLEGLEMRYPPPEDDLTGVVVE